MSVLVISGAAIRLGGRAILNGADLTVDQGRRIGLVGRNGAGKSTLLRAIAGELPLDGGDIRLAARARIATVAQEAPVGRRHAAGHRAARRPRAPRACSPRPTPPNAHPAGRDPRTPARDRRRCAPLPAPPPSSPASASTRPPRRARSRNSPAAGACAWRSPPRCSPHPTCCCSTSRPTTSTSKPRCGWRPGSPASPARCCWSRTTASCWTARCRRSPSSTAASITRHPRRLRRIRPHPHRARACSRSAPPNASPPSARTSSPSSTASATRRARRARRSRASRRSSACRRSRR